MIELHWPRSTPEDSDGRIALVRAALARLDAALELTRCEVGVDRDDSDRPPPRAYWTLARTGVYPDEAEMEGDAPDDEPYRIVDRVDRAAAEALLREAVADREPGVLLDMVAVEARSRGTASVEVRVQFWFLVGDASVEIESRAAGGASGPAIDSALAALLAAGWQREEPEDDEEEKEDEAPPAPRSTTEGADGHTLDKPVTIELDWPREEEDPSARAATAIEAIRLLAVAAEPCALLLTVGFADRDPEGPTPRRFAWGLEEAGEPSEDDLFGLMIRKVTALEPETMSAFIHSALAPQRPGGLFGWLRRPRPVGWTMLSVTRMRVELPDALRAGGRESLLLDCPGGPVRPGFRRAGPRALVEPLAEAPDDVAETAVDLMFLSGSSLHIHINWSPWSAGPGRALIDRAVTRLVQHGWKRP